MTRIADADRESFFAEVDTACRKAIWAAVSTVNDGEPRVRLVHPTWEGETLWFATDPNSPKALQISKTPAIDIQYQVAPPDFIHILVRGTAEIIMDNEVRKHVWDVLDYDLSQFFSDGPEAPSYAAVRITPVRVELSKMFGSVDKRVWRS